MTTRETAWIAIDHGLGTDRRLAPYVLALKGDRSLYQAIAEDDWVLVLDAGGSVVRAGRVLRIRSASGSATKSHPERPRKRIEPSRTSGTPGGIALGLHPRSS